MKITLGSEAKEELRKAIRYYRRRSLDAADSFRSELNASFPMIAESPLTYPILEDTIRRYLVRGFPYGILCEIRDGEIFVWAVMHLHRDPNYWKNRL